MAVARRLWLLGGALFGLFFVFFLLRGRGASISVLAGLMILLGVAWRRVEVGRIVLLLGLLAGAFVLANTLWEGGVIERFASTFNPTVVGQDGRLVIWREAWRMALDAPWLGIGLGTYWLAWPPYRHPQDGSGGFYVHNDYLQLWIEIGIPGLALLIAAYVAVLILFVRLQRSSHVTASVKIEAAGLFAGLFAIAAHSFVDFNLYTLPILLIAGLGLGRFQELCMAGKKDSFFVVQPSRWLRKRIYHTLILVLAAVPLTYFLTLGVSVYFAGEAKASLQRGEFHVADVAFRRAEAFMPSVDVAFLAHAEMLHRAIQVLPMTETDHRKILYTQAMELLDEAERSNNLRPQLYFLRGELYQVAPEPVSAEQVEQAYRTALKRDPRFHPARVAAAHFFLKQGDRKAARQWLEEGMRYGHYPDTQALPFYELTWKRRREDGDTDLARELADRIEEIHQRLAEQRGEVPAAQSPKLGL
jgi:tetratricopeptide (TPR) repeat protein